MLRDLGRGDLIIESWKKEGGSMKIYENNQNKLKRGAKKRKREDDKH